MGDPKVIKRITETDRGILYDLYRFRIMSREQIERIYFSENKAYTYRKMHIMKNSGLVRSKIVMRQRQEERERTAIYYITDRGLRLLRELEIIDDDIEAKDLQIDRENVDNYLDFNDIYVELKDEGYRFLDSRALKKKYQMERGDLCKGAIVDEDGKEYLVYVIKNKARESTMRRILKESGKKLMGMTERHNLILFRGMESYDEFLKMYDQYVLPSAYIMPFGFGVDYLKRYKGERDFVNLITKYGPVKRNDDRFSRAFPYVIEHKGEEKYAVNLMMNDLVLIDKLTRERLDKKALLFTHEIFGYDINERLKGVRGIEIIEITDGELMSC